MKIKVDFFTESKPGRRNEDFYGYNDNSFVVADGATDKSGKTYDGKTGGEIVAHLVVDRCLASEHNGIELVNYLNDEVKKLYSELGITNATKEGKNRFTCSFVSVRIVGDKIVATYLGDSGFRINGKQLYQEIKQIDIDNAEERARFIQKTGDIEGSRNHLMPFLIKQFDYQNNPDHKLGYGAIDGTTTPEKFVKLFEYDKDKVKTIELFTDGYFDFPQKPTIGGWEEMNLKVKKEDPYNYLKYKSTKADDDRTVLIINFS